MPRRRHAESAPGILLAAISLLLVVGLIHGVLGFGCYLVNEHRRLVWYEIVVLWLGDAIAAFWFVRYVIRWRRGQAGIEQRRLPAGRMPGSTWTLVLTLFTGMLAELGLTLYLRHDESVGFARAVPGVCTVTAIDADHKQGVAVYYKVDGHYADAAGRTHPVTYYIGERNDLGKLPQPTQQAIRQLRPQPLAIVYDPERPSRSWLPQLGWDDGNRLHYLSMAVLLFQFLFTLLFVAILRDFIRRLRRIPWWTELHQVLPLATEAFFMALFGGIELYLVQRFCP